MYMNRPLLVIALTSRQVGNCQVTSGLAHQIAISSVLIDFPP
jgi:hypothetical protein